MEKIIKKIFLILEKKENDFKLIDSSFVENIKQLKKIIKEYNDTMLKLNSEINEFKRIQISKDNEISRINELLLTKKSEIENLKKIIEKQKNGTREKEIEDKFKKEKERFEKKINDLEIRIYNTNEEKNNIIKYQKELQIKNEELIKRIKENEEENIKTSIINIFNLEKLKIIENKNFMIEKVKKTNEDYDIIQMKKEKEQLIFINNKLKKELNETINKYKELIEKSKINDNNYKENEMIIENYKSGILISDKIKKIIENSKKNHYLEIEQLKKKYSNESELLNSKNNSLLNINKERERKIKSLNDKIKILSSEKNELENVILSQEKKVNELEVKINQIILILNKKNEKIKENEKCTLQLINIVNDQQIQIKKLKRRNLNQNKSLNEILSLKTQDKNFNNNLEIKNNTIKNIRNNNLNLHEHYLRAFSTKKSKGHEKLLNKYFIKNEKKEFQKRRRFLKIKINDNEGQYYSTSNIVHHKKFNSNIPSKIGDDLVYLNVNMNWINTKTNNLKNNNEIEGKIKKNFNLSSKLPNLIYSNKNNSRINKLNIIQDEENEKKEEINLMMQKIIDEI